jgi:hypothetical protein
MKNPIGIILFPAVLLSSCSHYYYVANIQNVPLFKEKNEFRFSGAYAFGSESSCGEIQTAYSLTNNIGIMADYMHAKGGVIADKDYGKGNYYDGAIGYYKPIGEYGVFEIYGGLGGGSQHHEYSSFRYDDITGTYHDFYDGKSDLSFINIFMQPSLGATFNFIDVAFSTRACRVSFTKIEKNIYGNTNLYDEINTLSDNSHWYLEPAITFRAGWKYIKIQLQASYVGYLNRSKLYYFGEEYHFSAGLYVTLAKRLKKNVVNPGNAAFKW